MPVKHYCFHIPARSTGRIFEGIGGISSNGTSKLLMDYPAEQQSDIIDLLFKPNFGASLQSLKLEIGSDANTSSGTEPSHMRSPDDFNIRRGAGLWLAHKAKAINPKLKLGALRWGTPRWADTHEKLFLFYRNYLQGALEAYGLAFDYLGADINEGSFDRDWTVKVLRKGLDACDFETVGLVAADSEKDWFIADLVDSDNALKESLVALGVHYMLKSPEKAKNCGLPLWLSEDLAPFRTTFSEGALQTAQRIITMYTEGKMVKCELHPLFEGNYESTPFTYKGILTAAWPWSGHYRIDPGLWAVAHFTQFIKPGWQFLDSGCYSDEHCGCITLRDPEHRNISIIALNRGSVPCDMMFQFDGLLLPPSLKVWRSNAEDQFIMQRDLTVSNGTFTLHLEPETLYSLTTTTGQSKGRPVNDIPTETEFRLPYADDFLSTSPGKPPRYTLDQAGAFEVYRDKEEQFLLQMINSDIRPMDWPGRPSPHPYTLFGSLDWANYSLRLCFMLESMEGYAMFGGRVNQAPKSSQDAHGYLFVIAFDGSWTLKKSDEPIAAGQLHNFSPGKWYRVEMRFYNNNIEVLIDGIMVVKVEDNSIPSGQVVLGSGYNRVRFSELTVDRFVDMPSSCTRIDDTSDSLHISSGFERIRTTYEAYCRSLTTASKAGECMHFTFRGSSISIIGKKDINCGLISISIDDEDPVLVDTFSPSAKYRESLYSRYGIGTGEHTLRLTVEGRSSSSSTGTSVFIDAIEII